MSDGDLIPVPAGAKGVDEDGRPRNPAYPFAWLCRERSCDWDETHYGHRCSTCGAFVPFGCEPWAPDDDPWRDTGGEG